MMMMLAALMMMMLAALMMMMMMLAALMMLLLTTVVVSALSIICRQLLCYSYYITQINYVEIIRRAFWWHWGNEDWPKIYLARMRRY
jgi:hypothetical protein